MKTCYFTGTGNSLQVARGIGGELLSIPRLMRQGGIEVKDDAVGIVCPVYLGDCDEVAPEVRSYLKSFGIAGLQDVRDLGIKGPYIEDFERMYASA